MRNYLAQLLVVDENELQSLSELWTKVTGYFSVFKWKAEPEYETTWVFWKKLFSARGNSEGQVLKLGRRKANTARGMLGMAAILSENGEAECTMR